MDKWTRFVAALFLAAFASACSDEPAPTAPDAPVRPELGIVTDPDLTGLFFFGPPVGEDQEQPVDFDPTQLSVLTFEVCLEDDLDGTDPLADPCTNPLGRWTSDGGPSGISGEIFLVQDAQNDWYQVDVLFHEFREIELETTYVGRVIVGDPDVDVVDAYGAFTFVLVRNLSGGPNPPGGDMKVKFDRELPVKWFLGEGASEQLLCETERCTTKVILADDGGELCFPDEDCDSPAATAGASIQEGILPHDIVLKFEDSDPSSLGIPNAIEEAVDISATPPFDDLDRFDNDGDGVADIAVQLCYFTDDPDSYATYRRTEFGAERLPFDPRGDFIFAAGNCENGTNDMASLLGDGILGEVALALQTRVLRPAWRFLGPQPLRAGDTSSTADTRGFSVFAPAQDLDLLSNEEPPPGVAPTETVTISVCVETDPHDGSDPVPEAGVEVTFETDDGTVSDGSVTVSDGSGSGSSVVVQSALEPATTGCTNEDAEGNVAVARAFWTVSSEAGDYQARAFLDVVESVDGEGGTCELDEDCELSSVAIEVSFETTVTVGAADLAVSSWPEEDIPQTLRVGQLVPPFDQPGGSFTMENQGSGSAAPFSFELRLWDGPPADETEFFVLEFGNIPNVLEPGATATVFPKPDVPNVPAGDYHFGVVLDTGDDVPESDETNNIAFSGPITVTVPTIDFETLADGSGSVDDRTPLEVDDELFEAGATFSAEETATSEPLGPGVICGDPFRSLNHVIAIKSPESDPCSTASDAGHSLRIDFTVETYRVEFDLIVPADGRGNPGFSRPLGVTLVGIETDFFVQFRVLHVVLESTGDPIPWITINASAGSDAPDEVILLDNLDIAPSLF